MDKFLAMLRGSLKSWTMWFNTLVGSIATLAALFVDNVADIQAMLPQLQPYLTPTASKYLTLSLVIGNLVLRVKTNKALAAK